jgi:membrane protease YdiL (CAAX protease family)
MAIGLKFTLGFQNLRPAGTTPSTQTDPFLSMIEDSAINSRSAVDRFRAAITLGELISPQAGLDRLDSLENGGIPVRLPAASPLFQPPPPKPFPPLADDSPLRADIETARDILKARMAAIDADADVDAPVLETTARDEFLARHGLYGRLLLDGDDSPEMKAAAREGFTLVIIVVMLGLGICLLLLAGLVILITGAVFYATGRLRPKLAQSTMLDPAAEQRPGIWLETMLVFILAFLGVGVVAAIVAAVSPKGSPAPIIASLAAQAAIALIVLWPVVRGMSFTRFREELGWHSGRGIVPRGVLKEIGWGLLMYVGFLPVLFMVAMIVAIIMMLQQVITGEAAAPPDNEIIDLVSSGNTMLMVMLFLMATLWAPLVEEAIFRGALYRHVRSRASAFAAIALSAAAFALMHGYAPPQLLVIGSLGVLFGVMREFRGSIIASTTVHFVHNFTVMIVLTLVFSLADAT